MQSVISSRLDRLPPAHQLTLKVTSVIGTTFGARLLREIHPIEADRPDVEAHLEAAAQAGLVGRRSAGSEPTYEFSDSVTRDQAYRLLLFAQRRRLHRAVAEWYEGTHADDLTPFFPLLAHHWDAAEDPTKAGTYLELAGLHAQEQGTADEAAQYFRASLSLTAKTTTAATGGDVGYRDGRGVPRTPDQVVPQP